MIIDYNESARRFEARFDPRDFVGDLAAVKAAGFKTEGPPSWLWWTDKVKVLNKLRANRPLSGLTITDIGLVNYTPLAIRAAENDKVKAQLAEARKAAKKAQRLQKQQESTPQCQGDCPMDGSLPPCIFEGKELKPVGKVVPFVPAPHPGPFCVNCKTPVYSYEMLEPWPVCLWCEKTLTKV